MINEREEAGMDGGEWQGDVYRNKGQIHARPVSRLIVCGKQRNIKMTIFEHKVWCDILS